MSTSDDQPPWAEGEGPVGQLSPQDWLNDPATHCVLRALSAEGAEIRFVGGCVRDAILRRPVKDIDIATHDPPPQVMRLLEQAGIKVIPTGIDHGTVTALIGKARFEITTLRTDEESYGRQARVKFGAGWAEDAARRDFTINALFCNAEGMVFDPFEGLADLGAGRVRFVGNPINRINEDVLRLLRYFRFQAYYGRPPADIFALAACRAKAHLLPNLSGERVSAEMFKILLAPDPASALLLMKGENVLSVLLPEAAAFGRLRLLSFLEQRGVVRPSVKSDALRRLAAVLTVDAAGADAVAKRFKLSGKQKERLRAMAAPSQVPDWTMDDRAARRLLYHLNSAALFIDLLLLAWAGRKDLHGRTPAGETDRWLALLDLADGWAPPKRPVRGQDLLELGVSPGPEIGIFLNRFEAWWIDQDFPSDRETALAQLRILIQDGSDHRSFAQSSD
ncbi:MAG TPA: CCA tRNA nucleotidyltransferase [Rhodospirillaceae bacterium]|nr:CCA tRNA nucleotidyltransferase [Rhodospirillaceae bacterium]